jgi:DNA-binding NtrC family response regulator/CHASE2 domain-containing sensor protein
MSGPSGWSIRTRRAAALACVVCASFAVAYGLRLAAPRAFDRVDAAGVDVQFRLRHLLRGREKVSPRLVHVVVTDSSRKELALRDWDRAAFGEALAVLQEMGARTIACDVFFKDATFPGNDQVLLDAARKSSRILFPLLVLPGAAVDASDGADVPEAPPPRWVLRPTVIRPGHPPEAARLVLPFPDLAGSASLLGHINCNPDSDQVNRRLPLLYRYRDGFLPALSLAAALRFLDVAPMDVEVTFGDRLVLRRARAEDGTRRDISIPVDENGNLTVNFVGPWRESFPSVPLELLLGAAKDERLRPGLRDLVSDALVILSDVSTMNRDYGPGVFEQVYPLSGLHLNAANSILTGDFLARQTAAERAAIAAVLMAALWLAAIRWKGLPFLGFSALLYFAWWGFCTGAFIVAGLIPEISAPSAAILLAVISITGRGVVRKYTPAPDRVRRDGRAPQPGQLAPAALLLPSGKLPGEQPAGTTRNGSLPRLLAQGLTAPAAPLQRPDAFAEIITASPRMLARFRLVETIAADSNPVLITGESGVGKELVAGVVHRLSGRTGSLVCENVAGLDDAMLTDTLFGHQKGAFTDAAQERPGLVELARGGTLFLDEIGDMPVNSQVKLLRFIERKEYRPLGCDSVRVSDARIVIATNVDLEQRLREGRFREDLFYRLTHRIDIPPLRERLGDLPLLLDCFVEQVALAQRRKKPAVPAELVTLLLPYRFPGNVRELKNMVDNAMSSRDSEALPIEFFREYLLEKSISGNGNGSSGDAGQRLTFSDTLPTLKEAEDLLVGEALHRTAGNQNLAAKLLGMSPSALSRRLRRGRHQS